MSITNGYASAAQLQRSLGVTTSADNDLLEEAIQSASREIDKYCHRRFYKDANASARVYRPGDPCVLVIEDFYDTASLIVMVDRDGDGIFETTLTLNVDYVVEPLNGVVDGESGWPFWKIRLTVSTWPWGNRRPSVQVTAKWGWSAVPDPVYQACLIMARANYYLKDSKFGSAVVGDLGIVTVSQVPAAKAKLNPYVLDPVMVA